MTAYALLLVLLSALLHVAWNAAGKREHPSASFLLVANTAGGLCLLPVMAGVFRGGALPAPPVEVWLALISAGLFQAIYYTSLAAAYRAGDLSLAYPIARATPPVLVLLVSAALGRGERIGPGCVAGIGLIFAGGLLLPLPSLRALRVASYRNACAAFALCAAVGTAGYMLVDDHALRVLRTAPGASLTGEQAALFYAPFEALSASLWLSLWVLGSPGERAALRRVLRERKRAALLSGVGIYGSYTLVLAAMAFVADVSYVVALRQLSIPLGALVGFRLLGETPTRPRLIGVGVLTLGLVLVAIG